ncbi:uncharacterized protein C8A04DRAFT_34772 [Dichotomopilus funicola]|uniref:RING-CH-type domain-containing protein n=1 Tax=Dichotomopilus funicola TaxID=1934379 RepID=A0AAN6V841_9PEZI|nr:hypothetical protein C8A04DRAFT_34772 [Dichotomopilus funicola]
MAAPESSSGATPAAHTIIPAPIATNDQHACFICLQTDIDTPDATWVNPCPCSLEAHEECMLRWIAEVESGPRRANANKGGLQCPACKEPITVEDPFDPVLALRDILHKRYSRVSPYLLSLFVGGGGFAGAYWYGELAASTFAGHETVLIWLGFKGRPTQLPSTILKIAMLSSLGPGLVVLRFLPTGGSFLLLPFTAIYGATLVARDNLPSWPPSPQWAMALMPLVQFSYAYIFYDLFGPLEKRLNRALRGLPPVEEPAQAEAPAIAAPQPAAGARDDEDGEGVWGAFATVSRALLGIFTDGGDEDGADGDGRIIEGRFEINIGGGGDDDDDSDDELLLGEEALEAVGQEVGGDGVEILPEDAAQHDDQPQPGAEPIQQQQQPAAAAPAQPAQQNQQNQQPQNDARNNNRRRNEDRNNNNDGTSYFTAIINHVVTSLLLPTISYGMGELLRAALPRRWTAMPRLWSGRPVGLLHHRWGRSLVGGCLFIVLRDALRLYTKYRQVQVKSKRKIKNVEKRVPRSG